MTTVPVNIARQMSSGTGDIIYSVRQLRYGKKVLSDMALPVITKLITSHHSV